MEEWEEDQKIRFIGITKYPKNSKTKIKEQIKSTRGPSENLSQESIKLKIRNELKQCPLQIR